MPFFIAVQLRLYEYFCFVATYYARCMQTIDTLRMHNSIFIKLAFMLFSEFTEYCGVVKKRKTVNNDRSHPHKATLRLRKT